MSVRIASMDSAQLLELVREGHVDEPEILQVLRNPFCTVEVAELIADHPRWLSSHKVRERVAGTSGVSFTRALNLLATLPWLSLLQLAQEPSTPPVVRRHAEKKLLERINRMALGEKVALARRAHRPLFRNLVASNDGQVLEALLDNPRLVENDVLVMLNTAKAPSEFYVAVARHRRWGQCCAVRLALVECPNSPLPLALSALVQLTRRNLRDLVRHPGLPEKVRDAARALLEKEESGERRVIRFSNGDGSGGNPDSTHRVR